MGRAMKDSGVEWIGEIPEEWNLGRIGEIYAERKIKVSDTEYPPLSVTMKGIVPQLSTAAKTDAHDDRKLVCKGDFAINSRSDRRGSCGISSYDGSVSLINTILRPRKDMNPRYYNWLFHTSMFADEFYKWGHGIVDDLWTTNWQDMKNIFIPIPSANEQQIIASFLDGLCAQIDSVLEKTRSTIEEYKLLRQTVITQAVTKGVRGERLMKDRGIAWLKSIPSTWKIVPIKYFIDILAGYAFSSDDFDTNTGIPLLRGVNVTPKGIRWNDVVFWNKNVDEQLEPYMLRAGDLVLGLDRPWISEGTRISWVSEKDIPSLLLQRVCRIRAKDGILPAWIYYWLSNPLFMETLLTDTTGISVPHISTGQVGNFLISLPSIQEQKEIVVYLDEKCIEIDALITQKKQLLTELENYKKSLIYEYVTGKKEVPS
ncbi:MAG: restriction endonuclease subunit S [Lachnospiraceae bacterium]|nr:restriction endonuclease subunit S [Lachnospiraceae bacterium]